MMKSIQSNAQVPETPCERLRQSFDKEMGKLEQREDDVNDKIKKLEEAKLQLEEIMFKMPQDTYSTARVCDMSQIAPLIDDSKYEFRKWIESADLEIDVTREEKRRIVRKRIDCEEQFRMDIRAAQMAEEENTKHNFRRADK